MWTGEPVWRYEISKRGVNTGVAMNGTTAIVSHSEENLDTSEMGLLSAIDAKARGPIGKEQIKWQVKGWQGGFSSPVVDGDRLYQVDNGANLFAFDVNTGKTLWQHNLGTIQKASVVFGDGKIYVGSENGRFWILKPGQQKVEVLSEHQLGTEAGAGSDHRFGGDFRWASVPGHQRGHILHRQEAGDAEPAGESSTGPRQPERSLRSCRCTRRSWFSSRARRRHFKVRSFDATGPFHSR